MFARTLTVLFFFAAPALAAPPTAPMPREARYEMTTHWKHLWWDDEEDAARLWHELNFETLRRTVYGPSCVQNLREDVYQLAVQTAPMPRAAGVPFPVPRPLWDDPEAHSLEQLQLWHRMNFDSVYNTASPFLSYQAQRDAATRRSNPLSFAFNRYQQYTEVEFMKRYQEPLRFATQPIAAQEASEPPVQPGLGQFVAVADPLVCPPCPLPKIEVNPLLGTWFREVPGCVACATFTHDELKLTFAESDGTKHTATAQYTVTKDGLVFGAITGTSGPASLVDVPFSFRFRVTSDGVMVSAFKSEPMGDTARFCGLFKSAKDGKVPVPVAAKPSELRIAVPPLPPLGTPLDLPLPTPKWGVQERTPGVFDAPTFPLPTAPTQLKEPVRPASLETPPVVLPPALDGPPPMPPARPKGSPPPDGFKLMADDAFGSLLQQSGILPKPEPDPLLVASPAKLPAHVGTWHRELGPMTCVVKIDAEHVTITATLSGEENGKKVKQGVVMTGDYHLARDGTTLVGLVTGLDVVLEGVTAKDAPALDGLEEVSKMQKALAGQPFALTVRAYGDALVIGDVRVGYAGDRGLGEASALVAGRYKRGDAKVAEPKPLSRTTGATAPRIPMADAAEHARIKELLHESDTSGPPGFFWKQQYSTDPNVRMKQLRYETEDLRNIQNEWRRFWFNDQPSKLTPERIHGGIY